MVWVSEEGMIMWVSEEGGGCSVGCDGGLGDRRGDEGVGVGRGEVGVVLEGREGLDVRKWDDGCRKKHIFKGRRQILLFLCGP